MKKYLRKTASYLLSLGLVFSMSGSLVSAESTTGDGTDNGYEIQEPADDEQQETASGDQEVTDSPKGTEDSGTVVPADKTDGESDPDTPETSNESQTNTEPVPETEIQSTSDADTLNTKADITNTEEEAEESAELQDENIPAESSGETDFDLIEGVAYFSFNYGDIPVIYHYSDKYFETGSTEGYNKELAVISAVLANTSSPTSCESGLEDEPEEERAELKLENSSKNIQTILRELGYENIAVNDDYKTEGNPFTTGFLCGMKKVILNGEETTILGLFPRSFGYKEEWANNGDIGASGDEQGPLNAINYNVMPFVREYLSENGVSGNIKVWSAGASRGGGLSMLLGALMDDAIDAGTISEFLGADVSMTRDDIYVYTYGAPNFGDESKAVTVDPETGEKSQNPKYGNIYNVSADYDLVRNLLGGEWGLSHYGTEVTITMEEAKAKLSDMIEHYAAVQGTEVEDLPSDGYIYVNENGEIVYSPVDYVTTYKNEEMDLSRFLTLYMCELTKNTDRGTFAESMQDGIQAVLLVYMGNRDDKFNKLMEEIKPIAEDHLIDITLEALIKLFEEGSEAAVQEYFDDLTDFLPDVLITACESVGIDCNYDFSEWDKKVESSEEAKRLYKHYLEHLANAALNIGLKDPDGFTSMYKAAKSIWASHDPSLYLAWTRLFSGEAEMYLNHELTEGEKWGYRMVYFPKSEDIVINVYTGTIDSKKLEGILYYDRYDRVEGFDPYVHIGVDPDGRKVLYLRADREYILEMKPLNDESSTDGLLIDEYEYLHSYKVFDPLYTISVDDHAIDFSQILKMVQDGEFELSDTLILEIGGIKLKVNTRDITEAARQFLADSGAEQADNHEAEYYWISKLIQLGGAVQDSKGGTVNNLDYYLSDLLFDRNNPVLTASLTATPFSGYRFVGWFTPDGELVSTSMNFTKEFTFSDSSVLYYARFELIPDDKDDSKTDPAVIPGNGSGVINIPIEISAPQNSRKMIPNTSDPSMFGLWLMFIASINAAGASIYLLKKYSRFCAANESREV